MSKSNFRLTASVNNIEYSLLSISLRPDGDLIIDAKPGPLTRKFSNIGRNFPRITQTQFSVHSSLKSHDGNLLTYRQFIQDEARIETQQFTKAIKKYDRYACMFCRMPPDISLGTFDKDDGTVDAISIGAVDTTCCSPIISVFIGSNKRIFEHESDEIFKVYQRHIGMYNAVIIITYLLLPSSPHGDFYIPSTTKKDAEKDPVAYEEIFKGMDEAEAKSFILGTIQGFYERYVERMRFDFADPSDRNIIDKLLNYDCYLSNTGIQPFEDIPLNHLRLVNQVSTMLAEIYKRS